MQESGKVLLPPYRVLHIYEWIEGSALDSLRLREPIIIITKKAQEFNARINRGYNSFNGMCYHLNFKNKSEHLDDAKLPIFPFV